ncbi:hypothetical protein LTR66_015812, partial [Elasticomyces elasticus]
MSASNTARRASSRLARMRDEWICPSCQLKQLRLSTLNDGYSSIWRSQSRSFASTTTRSFSRSSIRSSDAPAPPLLAKFKPDLKTAMRAKDTPRLNVLRAMISDYNNSTKTNSPIKTDLQILALLKKKKGGSQTAAQEAKEAARDDLVQKQEAEIAIMDEYAGAVEMMSEDDILASVQSTIERLQSAAKDLELKAGNVLKELFKAGGIFDGKPVEKAQVAKAVSQLLSDNKGELKKDEKPSNS